MACLATQIAELNVKIATYEEELAQLKADLQTAEEAEPRDEEKINVIKNDIRRKEDAIAIKEALLLDYRQEARAQPAAAAQQQGEKSHTLFDLEQVVAAFRQVQLENTPYGHIKVSGSNADHGHAILSNLKLECNIRDVLETDGPAAIPFSVVEHARALFDEEKRPHERALVELFTPYLIDILSEVNSNLRLVNSEFYQWVHCMSGDRKYDLKPDLFSAHHSLVQYLPPYKNAGSMDRLFGKFDNWALRSSIHCIWDAKWKIDTSAFGEKCKYLQITGEGSFDHNGVALKLKGVLFDLEEFWMIRSSGNTIMDLVKCKWSQNGSRKVLSDFLSKIDPWLQANDALCRELNQVIVDFSKRGVPTDSLGPACLGSGANGRVFELESTQVLKVVVGKNSDMVEKEYKLMKLLLVNEKVAHVIFPVVPDSFRSGRVGFENYAGYLLAVKGAKINVGKDPGLVCSLFSSLLVLHQNNVTHGDPRIENALTLNGVVKWIDFRECDFVTTKVMIRKDVTILYKSLGGGVFSSNATEKIENYTNDPTMEKILEVAALCTSTTTTATGAH